jgi:putative molybdopterin biosynthesis protein
MRRKIYLDDVPLQEAWEKLIDALQAAGLWQPLEAEEVPLDRARDRVTAAPVWARLSSPHYHGSAMDGYAVHSSDTASASDANPVRLRLDVQAKYVDTGDPLPSWADAIIPLEDVQPVAGSDPNAPSAADPGHTDSGRQSASFIEIRSSVAPRRHVRLMGEDIVATELVLPANHVLRPVDLGAIAAGGLASVSVWRKPKVAVIPTGTELVPLGTPVKPGDILEYNSLVLSAQVEQWGGAATRYPIVPDDKARIKAAVAEAAESHDLVLLNAGSSAGSEDFSAQVVQELGALLVHGIAIRPGHPVVLGMIENSTKGRPSPIVGVPGFPVSAALTGELFVEPILARWLARGRQPRPTLEAVMTRKVFSPAGADEYLRVTVGEVGGRVVATPLARGAGVISSLVRADGLVCIPRRSEGFNAGDRVSVQLYRAADECRNTIVAIGSHDLTLDLMAQFLAEKGARLSSANVGSQGGLIALRRAEAHLAGSHLLDPETGEYNSSYIRQYLPSTSVVLVTLVGREQGLIVKRGNPLKLRSLADLIRSEVRFVNRQRGAGTRVLLDYEMSKAGLHARDIRGYEQEEYTHLAVAAAVASDLADCGLGIAAAAQALGLDFVSLFSERYDLIIPSEHYDSPRLAPLLDLLQDERFRREVASLPGYDVSSMGAIVERP